MDCSPEDSTCRSATAAGGGVLQQPGGKPYSSSQRVEHLPALSLSVSLCLARTIHTYTIEPVTERLEAVGIAGLATLQESLLIQKSLRAHTDRRARSNNVMQ